MRTFLCVVLTLLLPSFAFAAQFDDVLLTVSPENPHPGQHVTVTATVLGVNTAAGTVFTWLVDDKQTAQGVDNNTLAVDAPALGKTLSVRVLINGQERSQPLILRPADVTLEWEALTVSPPFYTGRALMGGQGSMRAFAVPELIDSRGGRVPAGAINFTWKINGTPVQKLSGYGKQTVVLTPPFYNQPFTLTVIANGGNGIQAERSVAVPVVDPSVVLYEMSPLGGLLDNSAVVNDYPFANDEVTFMAYPLNASQPASLNYQWTLDNAPVALNTGDPRLAVFRKTGSGTGQYTVGLNITSQKAFLDLVRESFLLHF